MSKARDLANAGTALGAVTATELAFVDGVTSAIQTQIDTKAPSSTAVTLTGTQTLTNKTLTNPVIASVVNNTLTSTTGDMIYASAANTPARLGIGSSAQVLTVAGGIPSWATASSGGMTLISTTALTGASTITISSIPTTGYKDLRLVLVNAQLTNNGGQVRCRPNNVSTAANYLTQYIDLSGTGAETPGDDTLMYLHNNLSNTVIENLSILHIYNYAETTRKIMQIQAVGVPTPTTTNFAYLFSTIFNKTTTAISSLTLISTAGNFNGGTAYVYGVN